MVTHIISTILLFSIIKQDVGCIIKIEITTGSRDHNEKGRIQVAH